MQDFRTMGDMVAKAFISQIAYCDYIAHLIQSGLKVADAEQSKLLSSVGPTRMDLSPEGALMSTAKTIEVEDRGGKKYLITVREL